MTISATRRLRVFAVLSTTASVLSIGTNAIRASDRQEPATAPAAPRDGSGGDRDGFGTVAGRVYDGGTGVAIAHARVSFELTGSGEVVSVSTGDDGQFAASIRGGRYVARGSAAGYLDSSYGGGVPGSDALPIELVVESRQALNIDLPLWGPASIEGLILGLDGRPTSEATVAVYRVRSRSGRRQLTRAGATVPDADGRYQLTWLLPGDYLVAATPPKGGTHTFHGGATTVSDAAIVALAPGAQLAGIDVALAQPALGSLEGVVFGAAPGAKTTVELSSLDEVAFTTRPAVDVDLSGGFSFSNLPPGRYEVTARSVVPRSPRDPAVKIVFRFEGDRFLAGAVSLAKGAEATFDTSSTMSLSRGLPPDAVGTVNPVLTRDYLAEELKSLLAGAQDRSEVVVTPGRIQRAILTLWPGATVEGRVVVSSGMPVPVDPAGAIVTLTRDRGPARAGGLPSMGMVADDGRLSIEAVPRGRYVVSLASKLQVRSAMLDGLDVFDVPFEVGMRDISGLVIDVGPIHTELSGTVVGASAGASLTAVLFAADLRYWERPNRRLAVVRPDSDGHYVFHGVPAGSYRLGLLTSALDAAELTPDLLSGLLPYSVPIELVDGVPLVENVRLAR